MNFLFWNTNGKTSDLICDLAESHDVDIFAIIENSLTPTETLRLLNRTKNGYYLSPSYSETDIQLYTRFTAKFTKPVQEERRLTARRLTLPGKEEILMVIIHYQSKLFWDDSNQSAHSPELKQFIEKAEGKVKHKRTLVFGDFNMNPFEQGMVQTTGLHCVMDRQIAIGKSRIVDNKEYHYFYNPMWSFYGEQGKGVVNGSFYYQSSKPICYFWNILDQVILRPDLISAFDENSLEILSEVNGISLLTKNGRVDRSVSDHLPIKFTLNIK